MDESIKKLKLKYEVKLMKHGFYFLDVVSYNERYEFLEYKNKKGSEDLLNSIVRIWKDNQTDNTSADLILENGKKYKHLSIKELFALLEEIENTGKIPLWV